MKKVVVASLLAFSTATITLGARVAVAQSQVNLGSAPSGDVQMSPAEYADYNAAIGQTDPKAKAAALEAYLTKYPQSAVKADTLQTLMITYSGFDAAKTLDAADRLLQVEPTNLRGLTLEVYFRKAAADKLTDASAKQSGYDEAASFAQKGIAAAETKPKGMSDEDFNALKLSAVPVFYSAVGTAALNKKDGAAAVDAFKKELASVPEESTKTPGPLLQDTYTLAQAYYQMSPPDLVNCTWYASRAAAFAPEPYKSQMAPLGKFCYRKYHGGDDGYDAVTSKVTASLNPPADLGIKPAPSPADIVKQVIASTPDLATLAISDKEFILQNGSPDDAAKVWDTIKGKSVQIPDALVIAATDTSIQVAVSDDAVQGKTADFTFNLKTPEDTGKKLTPREEAAQKEKQAAIAAATAVGNKVTLTGTYDSYTPKPIMITMSDAEVVLPKAAPTPAKRPAAAGAAHRAVPAKKP